MGPENNCNSSCQLPLTYLGFYRYWQYTSRTKLPPPEASIPHIFLWQENPPAWILWSCSGCDTNTTVMAPYRMNDHCLKHGDSNTEQLTECAIVVAWSEVTQSQLEHLTQWTTVVQDCDIPPTLTAPSRLSYCFLKLASQARLFGWFSSARQPCWRCPKKPVRIWYWWGL